MAQRGHGTSHKGETGVPLPASPAGLPWLKKREEEGLISIHYMNGGYSIWQEDDYTGYEYKGKFFVITRNGKPVGIYNTDGILSIEVKHGEWHGRNAKPENTTTGGTQIGAAEGQCATAYPQVVWEGKPTVCEGKPVMWGGKPTEYKGSAHAVGSLG